MTWLEELWADLLSEEPLRITAAWVRLDAESKASVREHLGRMATEEGWSEVQRAAAQIALDTIGNDDGSENRA